MIPTKDPSLSTMKATVAEVRSIGVSRERLSWIVVRRVAGAAAVAGAGRRTATATVAGGCGE